MTSDIRHLRDSLDKSKSLIHRHFIMSPSVILVSRNEDFLDQTDIEALADLEDNEPRIDLLLQMLKSRGYEFYRRFLLVLRKTGHNFLADKLEPIAAKKTVTFNSIPAVKEVTSSSSSSSSSSSGSSSSSSDDSDSDSRRRKKKVRKQRRQEPEPTPRMVEPGMLGDIPDDLRLPEPLTTEGQSVGPGPGPAGPSLDRVSLHYDAAKHYYRRRMDSLRHEEKQLRSSLDLNRHQQQTTHRNLVMVNTIKRQLAFVNDKEFEIRKSEVGPTFPCDKLRQLRSRPPPAERDTWTTMRGADLPVRASWKY